MFFLPLPRSGTQFLSLILQSDCRNPPVWPGAPEHPAEASNLNTSLNSFSTALGLTCKTDVDSCCFSRDRDSDGTISEDDNIFLNTPIAYCGTLASFHPSMLCGTLDLDFVFLTARYIVCLPFPL